MQHASIRHVCCVVVLVVKVHPGNVSDHFVLADRVMQADLNRQAIASEWNDVAAANCTS